LHLFYCSGHGASGFPAHNAAAYNPCEREAKVKGVLVVAVVCLAVGIGVIFGYCNGTTGLQFGYPLSASSIHIDITTTGAGVPIAVGLVSIGSILLVVATIIAVTGMVRRKGNMEPTRRRESAFEE
jgi:hypothetical protein